MYGGRALFVYHLGICTEAGRYLYITWVYVRRPGAICISLGHMYGGRALFVYHLGICTEAGRYLYITWVYVRRPGVISECTWFN